MTLEQFDEKILQKLKEEQVRPRARWLFVAKNISLWSIAAFFLLLSSLSVTLILHLQNFLRDDLMRPVPIFVRTFISTLPIFWLSCLTISVLVAFFIFRQTKKGYRSTALMLVGVALAASSLLGLFLYTIGVGHRLDDLLAARAPYYENVMNPHLPFWSNPAKGRLAGLLVSRPQTDQCLIVDREQKEWTISLPSAQDLSVLQIGRPARFEGRQVTDTSFEATAVAGMEAGRAFFKRMNDHMGPPPMENEVTGRKMKKMEHDLDDLAEKYPELKEALRQDIENDKAEWRQRVKRDPELAERLKALDLSPELLDYLGIE